MVRHHDRPLRTSLSKELLPVKLMVAQNIQYENLKFLLNYPLKPPVLDMDVSGKNHNVGANIRRLKAAKLEI